MIQTKQFPFVYIFILFSFFSFSQYSIEDAMKGKVAGLTIFSQSGDPELPAISEFEGMDQS